MFIPLQGDTTLVESSTTYHTILARKIGSLGLRPGRATTGLGTGVAIGLIGAFILGFFVRYIIRDRMAKSSAKAHVTALAAEDRALWGSRRIRGGSPTNRVRPGLPVYTGPPETTSMSEAGSFSSSTRKEKPLLPYPKSTGDGEGPGLKVMRPEPIHRGICWWTSARAA